MVSLSKETFFDGKLYWCKGLIYNFNPNPETSVSADNIDIGIRCFEQDSCLTTSHGGSRCQTFSLRRISNNSGVDEPTPKEPQSVDAVIILVKGSKPLCVTLCKN